jgi:hypothetical protein
MSNSWFRRRWSVEDGDLDRRRTANRLQRIAKASQDQEEAQIPRWLDFAKKIFDKDDDPDPQAA